MRTRPRTSALQRLAVTAALGMVLAACGPAPGPTATPTPTPVVTPAASLPPLDPNDAAAAIDELDSFQMDIRVAGLLTQDEDAEVTMQALVERSADAVQFKLTGMEGMPGGGSGLSVILIGGDAWVDLGTGSWIKQPGGASLFGASFDALSPAALMGAVPAGAFSLLPAVGREQKNGVATTHYRIEGSQSPEMAAELGPSSTTDVWVADDGGYLVSMVVVGEVDAGDGTKSPLHLTIDVSRFNDPTISIEEPD